MRLLLFILTLLAARAADLPPVTDFGPTNSYGANLQYSMRLMADSNPLEKRTVRVLFYGQSVTQQAWWLSVMSALQERFPNANLIITNRSIGFNSDILIRIAEADILPFYPDLVIYHNYGPPSDVEEIVRLIRTRTTADILLQTDHPIKPEDLTEPTDPGEVLSGDAWRNYVALPAVAERYGADLGDVRSNWKQYLIEHDLAPIEVLRDHIHPNTHGDYLMAEFVKSHLRVDRDFSNDSWREAVRTIPVDSGRWTQLTMPFAGNRVDLVIRTNGSSPVHILIDGKKPSEFPELYAFSRPDFYPGSYWPAILQVNSRKPARAESWSARVLESFTNWPPHVRFEVRGSETGYDGEGITTHEFVSNSGRVVLQPRDWLVLQWAWSYYPVLRPLPPGSEIKWESLALCVDQFIPTVGDPALENTVTVAQGLAHGPHTLTLTGTDLNAISAIRVYNPMARTQPRATNLIEMEQLGLAGTNLTIRVSGTARYVLEGAEELHSWRSLTAPLTDPELTLDIAARRHFFRLRKID